ncbi:MAG: PrgI family protein [bacterium]
MDKSKFMMFQVPQFIERETKIAGPLTLKQFLYLGGVGVAIFFLYYFMAEKYFFLFMFITAVLIIGGVSLAFIKVNGRSLSVLIINFLYYMTSSRMFLWHKKDSSPIMFKREIVVAGKESAPTPMLKIAERSQLRRLATKIETGIE